MLSARSDHTQERFDELASALEVLANAVATTSEDERGGADADGQAAALRETVGVIVERLDEVASAVQAITWRLPEVGDEVADRVSDHTTTALAGTIRLLDDRLAALRDALAGSGQGVGSGAGGFEAGAVMGAAQAAWNRLEQRLDTEFDDLGRQLQAMASLIEGILASTEDLANRPSVVAGEQLRKAASAVKETVVSASRTRRERRGGPRGLGPGES